MSHPSAPPPRYYQIDVIDQVGRAYRTVFELARLVGEMALLPYLITLAADLVAQLMPAGGVGHILAALIQAIGFLIFGSVFIVRWHRFVLLGESVGAAFIPPGWTDFLVAELKLGAIVVAGWAVLALLAVLPPFFLTLPLSGLGGVALTLFALRVSLMFPAAAIERPIGLRTAWDWIEGNFWRFFACAFAAYFPFVIAQMVIGAVGGLFPSVLWIVFEALRLAASFAGIAVIAALLSHLYRDIGENSDLA